MGREGYGLTRRDLPGASLADYVRVDKIGQVFNDGSIPPFKDNPVGVRVPAACSNCPHNLLSEGVSKEQKMPEGSFVVPIDTRDSGGSAGWFAREDITASILRLPGSLPVHIKIPWAGVFGGAGGRWRFGFATMMPAGTSSLLP